MVSLLDPRLRAGSFPVCVNGDAGSMPLFVPYYDEAPRVEVEPFSSVRYGPLRVDVTRLCRLT